MYSSNSNQSINSLEMDVKLNSIQGYTTNLFQITNCQLKQSIQLGQLFQLHHRCKPNCQKLLQLKQLEITAIKNVKCPPSHKLNSEEAKTVYNQEASISVSNIKKRISKKNISFIDKPWIIKKNCYIIRKLTEIGCTRTYISAMTGLSENQIYYRQKQIPISNSFQQQFHFPQNHIDWLRQYVDQSNLNELWNSQTILQSFLKEFELGQDVVSLKTFQKQIKICGFTFRQTKLRSQGYFTQKRKPVSLLYTQNLLSFVNESYQLIYLDETTFSHKTCNPKCWQLQKKKKYRRIIQTQNHLNIIGAIGQNGFACFQVCIGRVNQFVFGQFMSGLINKAINFYKNQKFVIIMDNSPIHHSKFIQDMFLNQINSLFLPPYSPELNPIEGIWNMLKQQVYKEQPINEFNLQREIHRFLKGISKRTIENFMKHTRGEIKLIIEQ